MIRWLTAILLCLHLWGHAQVPIAPYAAPHSAQQDKEPFLLKDRIWFGGGLGLNFGTITSIQIDPVVGVHLDRSRMLSVGLGPSYSYFRDNRYSPPFSMNAYGARVFTRFRPIEQAFLHAEFLGLNLEPHYSFDQDFSRRWVPHLLVGGGYVIPLGERSSFYLQVLFEVLQDPNSYYAGQGPIFSGGAGIGF